MRRYLAELIGTFWLVFAGAGAVMVNQITNDSLGTVGIGIVFGLAVMTVIYSIGHISGAHINPAVTLGFALSRKFPAKDVLPYWAAQIAGASIAALALSIMFGNVAGLGATHPSGSSIQSLWLEIILTFFLMFVVAAMAIDKRTPNEFAAVAIGGLIALEAIMGGPISGASMNPARSLGPALVSGDLSQLWIYIIGPLGGGALGALVYSLISKEDSGK